MKKIDIKLLMNRYFLAAGLLFLIFFLITPIRASAAEQPASWVMVKGVADKIISDLSKKLNEIKVNKKVIHEIINKELLPHFDLLGMSQSVVGRQFWMEASREQKEKFMKLFRDYVISTYSNPLSSYDGETVTFFPVRGYNGMDNIVQIDSNINHRDSSIPVSVQYKTIKKGGEWLIYDFSIEGVSLAQNYRSQFSPTLQKGGLDLLVEELQSRVK